MQPWADGFAPDPRAQGSYTQAGRRPSQTRVTYRSTADSIEAGDIRKEFFEAHTLDKVVFPTTKVGDVLDVDRIVAELNPDTTTVSTIVQSRLLLAASVDLAIDAAGLDPFLKCQGDYAAMDMAALVGHLLPVWGPSPSRVSDSADAFAHVGKVKEPHQFAFRPCIVSTVGDGQRGDQGEVVAQGVTVTGRLFNFARGDPRRVRLGANEVFEDTCAWVLVTHAYSPPLPYARLNKESLKRKRRPADDPFEAVFRWEDYMTANSERIKDPGYAISTFGLLDTKQTGKDVLRAIVLWPVGECATCVEDLRRVGLDRYLVETPMRTETDDGVATGRRSRGGMDLRRMLLMELVLRGTPLEGLWTRQPVRLPCRPVPVPREALSRNTRVN